MPEDYLRLKGTTSISEDLLSTQLEANIVSFFNWGMLNIGGFTNYQRPNSGPSSENRNRLRLVKDPNYASGRVWEGFRRDWVWESGVYTQPSTYQPIQVSGVWVDTVFYPIIIPATGVKSHVVDYPNGRIIFNTALPTGSVVEASFSTRFAHFTTANAPWFRYLQQNSYQSDSPDFLATSSGLWNQLSQTRTQCPTVAVEIVPNRTFSPYALGGGQYVKQDVIYHIITETKNDCNKLMDIISYQNDKTIKMYDTNAMATAGAYPLNYSGSIATGAKTYPFWVEESGNGGYYNKTCSFEKTRINEVGILSPVLYLAQVRTTCVTPIEEI